MNQLSDVYTLDPTTIKFDDKYVVFNPLHTLDQYLATKASIKDLGQLDPILMLDGVCVDGRHRVRVCKELDIPVRCIDLPAKTSEEEIVLLCNKSTTSGRDFTMSQKAIQALKMVNNFNFPIVKAAMHMKVDRKLVSYASTIKGFGRQDLLDQLLLGKAIQLTNMDKPTTSLEVLCKYVKKLDEVGVVEDRQERIQFNPDAHIKTEAGKVWYYERIASDMVPDTMVPTRMVYAELANYKFRKVTDE